VRFRHYYFEYIDAAGRSRFRPAIIDRINTADPGESHGHARRHPSELDVVAKRSSNELSRQARNGEWWPLHTGRRTDGFGIYRYLT
jgi:hypothetical protein